MQPGRPGAGQAGPRIWPEWVLVEKSCGRVPGVRLGGLRCAHPIARNSSASRCASQRAAGPGVAAPGQFHHQGRRYPVAGQFGQQALVGGIARHVPRQPAPAQAAHQQFGEQVEAVGAPDLGGDLLAAGIRILQRCDQQLAVAGQFAPPHALLARQGMLGAAGGDLGDIAQGLALQGLGHVLMAKQQAEVGLVGQQLARHIALGAAGELDLQVRKGRGQGVQGIEHRLVGHGLVQGQAQQRFLSGTEGLGAAVQALALAQHLARLLQQGQTGRGDDRRAAVAAHEQGHAQVGLQQGDGRADRRLRPAQTPRHRRETRALSDADEDLQLLKIPLHDPSPKQIGINFHPSCDKAQWAFYRRKPHERIHLPGDRHRRRSRRHHLHEGHQRLQQAAAATGWPSGC